jgi:parallel beta-helix repeat protein
MKRIFSGLILILLLIGTLTLAFNIQPVKASGTIYIKNNGKVDPSIAPISTVDNITYTFTGDIKYPTYLGIVIERNNIVVNGNGHTIQGSGVGDGFSLSNISNVTIKNVNVEEFSYGIFISSSININISQSSIANNENGLYFDSSSNDKISRNKIKENNGAGILLINHSNTTTVKGNNITNNYFGIYLSSSSNANSITDNNITTSSYYGIMLDTSAGNDISRNNIKANNDGIGLSYSSNNKLRDNILANNTYNFDLWGLTVTDFMNDVDASNTVDSKKIYYWTNKQDAAIPLDAGYVSLVNCTRIAVQNLNLTKNKEGILLVYTTNSTIIQNDITSNYIGIRLRNSSGNFIYHNSLVNNVNQVNTYDSQNAWDDGYPSGGNYWSD